MIDKTFGKKIIVEVKKSKKNQDQIIGYCHSDPDLNKVCLFGKSVKVDKLNPGDFYESNVIANREKTFIVFPEKKVIPKHLFLDLFINKLPFQINIFGNNCFVSYKIKNENTINVFFDREGCDNLDILVKYGIEIVYPIDFLSIEGKFCYEKDFEKLILQTLAIINTTEIEKYMSTKI